MSTEIERKFLLKSDAWRSAISRSERCKQGYLTPGPPVSVRIRIMGGEAKLNLKESTLAIARKEFEYTIPMADAEVLLSQIAGDELVEKTRHWVEHEGKTWEVDEFEGANTGLIVAEIELDAEHETFSMPPWAGEEVSEDSRYRNSSLASAPFRSWP